MQIPTVQLELREVLIHLQDLIQELKQRKKQADAEPALALHLGHILDHISLAWNCKDMSPEKVQALPQSEFERLSHTVPNFLGGRIMGDVASGEIEIAGPEE